MSTASPSNPSTGASSSRRKRHSEPDATRRIVVASFSNETDALEILAKAATDADDEPADKGEENGTRETSKRVIWADGQPRPLSHFVLIARGILDERMLELLVNVFFTHHHPVLVSCKILGRTANSEANLPDSQDSAQQGPTRGLGSRGPFPDLRDCLRRVTPSSRSRNERSA
jgi:hypothetical protein